MTISQRLTAHLLLMIGAFFMTFPFIWMVLTSLKDPKDVLKTAQHAPPNATIAERVKNEIDAILPSRHVYLKVDTGFDTVKEIEVEKIREEGQGVLVRHASGASLNRTEVVPKEKLVERTYQWQNYATAWSRGKGVTFSRYMINSFVVAILCTLGNVITSLFAAYAFTFFEFPLKGLLFSLLMITMMVPQQVLLVPDFLIVKELGWYNTYWALFMPWVAGVFGIFLLRQFFLTLPRDLYEAAMIDGCSRLGFLLRILVPLSVPPIITMSISVFLSTWNALIWPLTVVDKPEFYTIQVGLSFFTNEAGTRWELLMAASAISILPLVVLYFFAQRQFIEGIAQTGIKG
jgi:multiple sugar transport system permease protein